MLVGMNQALDVQVKVLGQILRKNKKLMILLEELEEYADKHSNFKNYYVGAGSINQTVFNYYHNFEPDYGIKDFDLVYFDSDLSYEKEDLVIQQLSQELSFPSSCLDIKNEARVHLWRKEKDGTSRCPYSSVEEAISEWGATVTCIGVRLENGRFKIFAPYGLQDIFSMTIRPVKIDFTKELYESRSNRWKEKWPQLFIVPWN